MTSLRIRSNPRTTYWLLAGLSLAGYLVLRLWMPLAPYAAPTPLPDIARFARWPWGVLAYVALLSALFWVYWLAYRQILASGQPLGLAAILIPAAVFAVVLLGVFPINALDVYDYLLLGRVQVVYGQNPYLVAPNVFPHDPFLKYVGEWGGDTSPYGPVFQHIANVVALLSRNLLSGLLLFKALAALAMLGSTVLIWLLLAGSDPKQRAAHTLLWAWNPALLLTFAVDAHNDGLMIFWLLLGLWLVRRKLSAIGFAVMALAALTKLSGLLPIPFFLLAAVQSLPTLRSKIRLLAVSGVTVLAVTWLVYLPFGSPISLVERLMRTATGAGYTPLTVVLLAAGKAGIPISSKTLAAFGVLVFAALTLWLLWRTWKGRSPLRGAADVNAAYVVLSVGFRIWYAVWPFPWLLLDVPAQREADDVWVREFRLRAGLWFLVTTQFSVLIYGQVRRALLGGDIWWAHVVGVLFTFALPLVLAWLGSRRYQRA